ncbi:MAG: DUF4845 domain-containing protein [Halioglobus sp.]
MQRKQAGMSILGTLIVLIMAGFFVMCALRMGPLYFEYLSVRDIISRTVVDPETAGESNTAIRGRLETIFNTNRISALKAREIEIYRKDGNTFIDASYEARLPIVWRIDAVLKFDDLLYRVGQAEPVSPEEAPKKG